MPCMNMNPDGNGDLTDKQQKFFDNCFDDDFNLLCSGIDRNGTETLCTGMLPGDIASVVMGLLLALLLVGIGIMVYLTFIKGKF